MYPKEIIRHNETTSNFSHPENFVVFECVHRLLEKGYKPSSLELEPRWNLGRDKKGGKADILVRDLSLSYENNHKGNPYLIIECKTSSRTNEKANLQKSGIKCKKMADNSLAIFSKKEA